MTRTVMRPITIANAIALLLVILASCMMVATPTGRPITHNSTLIQIQYRTASTQAVYLQLYRRCGSNYCLRQSVLSTPAHGGQPDQTDSITLKWPVEKGDLIGIAPGNLEDDMPQNPISYATADLTMGRNTSQTLVTMWYDVKTQVGTGDDSQLKPSDFAFHNQYLLSLQYTLDQVQYCDPPPDMPLGTCLVGSPYDSSRESLDTSGGVTSLLIGHPLPVADVIRAVTLTVSAIQPFYVQLWRPTAAKYTAANAPATATAFDRSTMLWTLVSSVLVDPPTTGPLSVPVDWVALAGDAIGFNTPLGSTGAIPYGDALDSVSGASLPESVMVQLDSTQVAAVGELPKIGQTVDFTSSSQYYREYNIGFEGFTVCSLVAGISGSVVGSNPLLPLALSENEFEPTAADPIRRTTIFTGSTFNRNGTVTEARFYASNLNAIKIQLFRKNSLGALTLIQSVPYTPTVLGLARIDLNWFVSIGDTVGIASSFISPLFYRPVSGDDSASAEWNSALLSRYTVSQYGEVISTTGQAILADAVPVVTTPRAYNIRFVFRANGWCSGAEQKPDVASIGTCTFINSTSTPAGCSFVCPSQYRINGTASLMCSTGSSGSLVGSQQCVPLGCTIPSYSNTLSGTCGSTLASGESCSVACQSGFVSTASTLLTCDAATLRTDFTGCVAPVTCKTPATLPTGTTWGNCTGPNQVLYHGDMCVLQITSPYSVVSGSTALTCYNGVLTPSPTLLKSPCTMLTLGKSVTVGSCPSSGVMETGTQCDLECAAGFKMTGSGRLSCSNKVLGGSMPQCTQAPSCSLPDEFPPGALPGTCKAGGLLAPTLGACKLAVATGYALNNGSSLELVCNLGVRTAMPGFTPLSCAITAPPAAKHVAWGKCASSIASGTTCRVACDDDHLTSDSPFFACNYGVLTGAWPQCRLPTCMFPSVLPEGVERGTCTFNSLMRADGEQYPAACTMTLKLGYTVASGALTISCGRDGQLSEIPVAVEAIVPTVVAGTCGTSAAHPNFGTSNDINVLPLAGSPVCASGFVVQSWSFDYCDEADLSVGIKIVLRCVPNALLSANATTTAKGGCTGGNMSNLKLITSQGTVMCPDQSAVVGINFAACTSSTVQLVLTCKPLIAKADQLAITGLYSDPQRYSIGVCGGATVTQGALAFGFVGMLATQPCPYTRFNYMQGLDMASCGSDSLYNDAQCVIYQDSIPGLMASPVKWYGADVRRRTLIDSDYSPHCLLFQALRIQTSGEVTGFRFYANNLGTVTFQTYGPAVNETLYKVKGSFTYTVTKLGYQMIGLPASKRWSVLADDSLGYCFANTPIIPFEKSDYDSNVVLGFSGAPVAVGTWLGGGGDAGVTYANQGYYSLQISIGYKDVTWLGWPVVSGGEADTLTDGNCLLLDHPRISTYGTFSYARFFAHNNNGEVLLQTYRETTAGKFVLIGSYQTPTLKRGIQTVTLPRNSTWQVKPGDLMAHCYTRASIGWDNDPAPVDAYDDDNYSTQYYTWNRPDDYPSTKWISYNGDIQRNTTGGNHPLLGSSTYGFSNNRRYAVQFGFQPTSACKSLPRAATYGNGVVSCTSLVCTLTCNSGYGTANPRQTCSPTGSWGSQGMCLALGVPTFAQSWSLQDIDQYSTVLNWAGITLPDSVYLLGWELRWTTNFPVSSDLQLEALDGVRPNATGTIIFGPTTNSYTHVMDSQSQIEHVGVNFRVRMLVTGGTSAWVSTAATGACACNLYRSLSTSHDSVSWGLPFDLATTQATDAYNNVRLSLLPNSLCTDSYEVRITAVDGTTLDVEPIVFNTPHADTRKSCSLFSKVTQQLTKIAYPLHGRDLKFCVYQRPMYLCEKCVSQYSSGQSDSGATPPPVCTEARLSFVVPISGRVATTSQAGSTVLQGVGDVTITALVLDPDTMEPLSVYDPALDALTTVTATGVTGLDGKFSFKLVSNLLSRATYGLRVTPSKSAVDSITGLTFTHVFVNKKSRSLDHWEDLVSHYTYANEIPFEDTSSVPIVGQVLLPRDSRGIFYGSTALQGCGVPDITVKAYAAHDTDFETALAEATATLADGKWQLAVPIYTSIVLRATGTTDNRTFSPSTIPLTVRQSVVQAEPFYDVSVASFQLEIDGGNCHFPIGSVRPTAIFDSCGASANVFLPAFADGAGYTYTLPAVAYTVKLYDSKNPFSGLQGVDLDGTQLPNDYLNGDVFNFIAVGTSPFSVELTPIPAEPLAFSFNYIAPPAITREASPCTDPKAPAAAREYSYAFSGQNTTVKFNLIETYGYVSPTGQDRTTICGNVNTGVEFLDAVTAVGTPLVSEYVESYGCSTGSNICALPPVYNEKSKDTTVEYNMLVGPIQRSAFSTDDTDQAHTQPAYSRVLQYRPAGSVLAWTPIYYVVMGTHVEDGSLSMVYPPWDAFYILRDPPGGSSTASVSVGHTISSATSLNLASSGGIETETAAHVGYNQVWSTCVKFTIGFVAPLTAVLGGGTAVDIDMQPQCLEAYRSSTLLTIGATGGQGTADDIMRQRIVGMGFDTTISTSGEADVIDGDGDLFLTAAGSFSLALGTIITVDLASVIDELTGAKSTVCTATSKPTSTWSLDKGLTYQWVSQADIKNVHIANLEIQNKNLLLEGEAADIDELQEKDTKGELASRYKANLIAVKGWTDLLAYNDKLKEDAVEWPEFYSSLRAPGASGDDRLTGGARNPDDPASTTDGQKMMNSLKPTPSIGRSSVPDQDSTNFDKYLSSSNFQPYNMSDKAKPKEKVNSITYYGDAAGALLTFEVSASSSNTFTRHVESHQGSSIGWTATAEGYYFGFGGGLTTDGSYPMEITHGTLRELGEEWANTLTISLGDPDPGDMFHVEIWKDPVYGSPVYKLISGQSRCPTETGTVAREAVSMKMSMPYFSNVHPAASVSTLITLSNQSPTREPFTYSLTQAMETNPNGLKLYVNGQLVNSDPIVLQFDVDWNVNALLTLVAERGEASYDFTDVGLTAQSSGGGGTCAAATASISVVYDEPCASIAFAGPLAVSGSFTINSQSALASKGAMMSVTVYNPKYTLNGRKWMDQIARGYLNTIDIQYRSAGTSTTEVLSDADWQSVKRIGDTIPSTPIVDIVSDGYAAKPATVRNDFITVSWDMSTLGDGNYQLRALTQCAAPIGSLDTSLYTFVTPILTGTLDVIPPKVFGDPLPAGNTWLPGQEISVTFNKAIACNSYYGKTVVDMWINPTMVAQSMALGQSQRTLFVCSENKITIQPYAPVYDTLVGRLLTVRVSKVYDTAGNLVSGDTVTWSFEVGSFSPLSSMGEVSALIINGTVSQLQSRMSATSTPLTLIQLQQVMQQEVADFTNAMIDLVLKPATKASTSSQGLQAGAVTVSQLATRSVTLSDLTLQFHPYPSFPGEPTQVYSPSLFLHYFLNGLENTTLWRNAANYPLLSQLIYNAAAVTSAVYPIQSGATSIATPTLDANRRAVHLMSTAATIGTVTVTAGLNPTDRSTCIVILQWQETNLPNDYVAADLNSLAISYRQLSSAGMDPDTASTLDLQSSSLIDVAAAGVSIISNVQSAQQRAIYSLQILKFPTRAGGFNAEIRVDIRVSNADYSLTQSAFLFGIPTTPIVSSVSQNSTSPDLVTVRFLATQLSGSNATAGDTGLTYALAFTQGTNTVTVPTAAIKQTRTTDTLGMQTITATVNMSLLANQTTFVKPTNGASATIAVAITATSTLATSAAATSSVRVHSLPPSITIARYSQTTGDSYLLHFEPAVGEAVTSYVALYRSNASTGVPVSFELGLPSVVSGSSPSVLSATIRLSSSELFRSKIFLAVFARTIVGATQPVYTQATAPSPAFVSAPTTFTATAVTAPTQQDEPFSVRLSWGPSDITTPGAVNTATLVTGYRVSYSVSDGASLHTTSTSLLVGNDVFSYLLPLTFSVSPLIAQPTIYAFFVETMMLTTDVASIAYRTDGTGAHTIASQPAQATLSFVQPVIDMVVEPTISNITYLEGDLTTLPAPSSLRLSYPADVLRASWSSVAGASGYALAWFDGRSSSKVPIGIRYISSEAELDGALSAQVPIVAETDAPFAIFKIAVWAQQPELNLESQRVISFLSLPPVVSTSTLYVPTLYLPEGLASLTGTVQSLSDGTSGFNFTAPLASTYTLRLQMRSPTIQKLRIQVVQATHPAASIASLFTTCSGLEPFSPLTIADQVYDLTLVPEVDRIIFVYLELTAESGLLRYSSIAIDNTHIVDVQLALLEPVQYAGPITLTPPFRIGYFTYVLDLPEPTDIKLTALVDFKEGESVRLLAGAFNSSLVSGNVSSSFVVSAGSTLLIQSALSGSYSVRVLHTGSAMTQLQFFAKMHEPTKPGVTSIVKLYAPFVPLKRQYSILLPYQVSEVELSATFYSVYSTWLISNGGACGSGPVDSSFGLSSGVSSPRISVSIGVTRLSLCSSHDERVLIEFVRSPPSVARIFAAVRSSSATTAPLQLAWSSELTAGTQAYSATVYVDREWIQLGADFTRSSFVALTNTTYDTPAAPYIGVTATNVTLTLNATTGQTIDGQNVTQLLASGASSEWIKLSVGENVFTLSSFTDGDYIVRVRRLPVSYIGWGQEMPNSTLVIATSYKSTDAAVDTGVALEITPPFDTSVHVYRLAQPLPFLSRWVSLTSFATTFGLVRVMNDVLAPGVESARVLVPPNGVNLTLFTESGIAYVFQLDREAGRVSEVQLVAYVADGSAAGSVRLPAPFAFNPEVHSYSWAVPFGTSSVRIAGVYPDGQSFIVEYASAVMPLANGADPDTAVNATIQLDATLNTHVIAVITPNDGVYTYELTRTEADLTQVLIDAISLAPDTATSQPDTVRVEFDRPVMVGQSSRDNPFFAYLPFQYNQILLTSFFTVDRSLALTVDSGAVLPAEYNASMTLTSSSPVLLNVSVGVNDFYLHSSIDGGMHFQLVRGAADLTRMNCSRVGLTGDMEPIALEFVPGVTEYHVPLLFAADEVVCTMQYSTPDSVYMQMTNPNVTQPTPTVPRPKLTSSKAMRRVAIVDTNSTAQPGVISSDAPYNPLTPDVWNGVAIDSGVSTPLPLAVGSNVLQVTSATDGQITIYLERELPIDIAMLMRLGVARGANQSVPMPVLLDQTFYNNNFSYTAQMPYELLQLGQLMTFNLSLLSPNTSTWNLTHYVGLASTAAAIESEAAIFSSSFVQDGLIDVATGGWDYDHVLAHPWFRVQVIAESGAVNDYYIFFDVEVPSGVLLRDEPVAAAVGALYATGVVIVGVIAISVTLGSATSTIANASKLRQPGFFLLIALILRMVLEYMQYGYPDDSNISLGNQLILHALPVWFELACICTGVVAWMAYLLGAGADLIGVVPRAPSEKAAAGVATDAASQWAIALPAIRSWVNRLLVCTGVALAIVLICTASVGSLRAGQGFVTIVALMTLFTVATAIPALIKVISDVAQRKESHGLRPYTAGGLRITSVAALVFGVAASILLMVSIWRSDDFSAHVVAMHGSYAAVDLAFLLTLAALIVLLAIQPARDLKPQKSVDLPITSLDNEPNVVQFQLGGGMGVRMHYEISESQPGDAGSEGELHATGAAQDVAVDAPGQPAPLTVSAISFDLSVPPVAASASTLLLATPPLMSPSGEQDIDLDPSTAVIPITTGADVRLHYDYSSSGSDQRQQDPLDSEPELVDEQDPTGAPTLSAIATDANSALPTASVIDSTNVGVGASLSVAAGVGDSPVEIAPPSASRWVYSPSAVSESESPDAPVLVDAPSPIPADIDRYAYVNKETTQNE